jgi:4-nitrophenyl phosphatase
LAGVPGAMRRLDEAGIDTFFITNNSTRTPQEGAQKITRLTGIEVGPDRVLSSSLAAVGILQPDDGPVLVVGEAGVSDAVSRAGLEETDDPLRAGSVLVGLARDISYETIGNAMAAIRNGARYIATNDDTTFPTENGLAPGCGAIVAAITAAAGIAPIVAGKPNQPMLDLILSRGVTDAWVIGDRLDTDIAIADHDERWRSILVMTGVTKRADLEGGEADFVVDDFPRAVDLVLEHHHPS